LILQAVLAYVFYERHWDTVTRWLAVGVAGEVSMLVDMLEEGAIPRQNIIQAVRPLRNEDRHARQRIRVVNRPIHLKARAHFLKCDLDGGSLRQIKAIQIPFHTHKKHIIFRVDMLVKVQDVAVVLKDKFGYSGDKAPSIWTREK
jgi:hypothetical protein